MFPADSDARQQVLLADVGDGYQALFQLFRLSHPQYAAAAPEALVDAYPRQVPPTGQPLSWFAYVGAFKAHCWLRSNIADDISP